MHKKKTQFVAAADSSAPRRVLQIGVGLLLVLALPDLVLHKHTYFYSYEALPGFFALLGLAAIAVLAGIARVLGSFLRRGEDYYD